MTVGTETISEIVSNYELPIACENAVHNRRRRLAGSACIAT